MKKNSTLAPKLLAALASTALISGACTGEPTTTPATTANEVSPETQPAEDENTQGDQSPITGTQGTSGEGRASADPTYGGTTGTTEGTGWEETPAGDEDEEDQKKKAPEPIEPPRAGASQTENEMQSDTLESYQGVHPPAVTNTREMAEERFPPEAIDQPAQDRAPAAIPRSSDEAESESSLHSEARPEVRDTPVELREANPARAQDPLLRLEPYSRMPHHVGSVQITGKDKSVAILERTSPFADPNALARNEAQPLATRPVTELSLAEEFDHAAKREFQATMTSRLQNLEQRLGILRAIAINNASIDRSLLMDVLTSLDGEQTSLNRRVEAARVVGEPEWPNYVRQFQERLTIFERQIAQLDLAVR
jgi:hypothetical protein